MKVIYQGDKKDLVDISNPEEDEFLALPILEDQINKWILEGEEDDLDWIVFEGNFYQNRQYVVL